jgi:hypothetical protein
MGEKGFSPEPQAHGKLSDSDLLETLEEALRLFESRDEQEQQLLEEEVLPKLSRHFNADLIASSNTQGDLVDELDALRSRLNQVPKQGV